MRNYLILICLLFASYSFSQRCGHEVYQHELDRSLIYQAQKLSDYGYSLISNSVELRDSNGNCKDYVIKTIVHFSNVSDSACATEIAHKNIEIMNKAMSLKDVSIYNWQKEKQKYDFELKKSCLRFKLDSVVFHNDFKSYRPDFKQTFNIFVGQIENNVLGYSPLNGSYGDGVVVSTKFFDTDGCLGLGSNRPYNLGKTLVHEFGHFGGLNHIWGGGCSKDDGITDTPNQATPHYNCPENPNTCESYDLHINYMDYTTDNCMCMFTPNQVSVMEQHFTSKLQMLFEQGKTEIPVIKPQNQIKIGGKIAIYGGAVFLLLLFGFFALKKRRAAT